MILQIIDVENKEAIDVERESKELLKELREFDSNLTQRVQWLVLNKIDLIQDRYEIELWQQAFRDEGVELLAASGLSGENTQQVLRRCAEHLETNQEGDPSEPEPWSPI